MISILFKLIFLLMVFLCVIPSWEINAQSNQDVSQDVEKAILNEDWATVAQLLDTVTSETSSPVLRLIKGHACLALNRNNESVCLFLSVVAKDSIKKYEDLNSWKRWCEESSNKNPQRIIPYYLLGDAFARLQEWDQAISSFSKALRNKPSHSLVLHARGVCYASLGKWDLAREDFVKASENIPNLAELCASRGTFILQRRTDARIAMSWFDQALSISPNSVLALNGKGGSLRLLGDPDSSTFTLMQAKNLAKDCLDRVSVVVDLNLAISVDERNELVAKMLTQLGGIEPGMSIDEKLNMMKSWSPANRQRGFDILNNAYKFNDRVLGSSLFPDKIEIGISGGIKGSIIGPQPYLEGRISVTKDLKSTASYNLQNQSNLMASMKSHYGVERANPINNIRSWALQHMPGMDYGKLTKPGGVSSKEIEGSIEGPEWKVFTVYGLLYSMKAQ